MGMIFKNLWARRKHTAWIVVELVLVSIVSWFVLDPLFVIVYNTWEVPDGYDADRLCVLGTSADAPIAQNFQHEEVAHSMEVIKNKLINMEEVESVSLTYERNYPNACGEGEGTYGNLEDTTKWCLASLLTFRRGEDMFRTLGLEVLDGDMDREGLVVTKSLARKLFGKTEVAGAMMMEGYDLGHPSLSEENAKRRIAAVVEDIKMEKYADWRYGVIMLADSLYLSRYTELLVRLKTGVNADAFCTQIRPTMQKELKSGHIFVCKVESMQEKIDWTMRFSGVTGKIRRYISLAVFFLVNLCLGTVGTFWLQTRKRKGEIGIMRSYGASKGHIMRSLMLEGFLLTAVCHLLGSLFFFQYAYSQGLATGLDLEGQNNLASHITEGWIHSFAPHFFVVGTFIFLILWTTVSIGIAIPVWNICRTKIVNALGDE